MNYNPEKAQDEKMIVIDNPEEQASPKKDDKTGEEEINLLEWFFKID